MSAISDAERYVYEHGKVSYSPLDTKNIIVALLAEIESLQNQLTEERGGE